MGIGTWAWGNKFLWDYDPARDAELQAAFNYCVEHGLNWFDSADSYGTGELAGRSEILLGKFIQSYKGGPRDDIRVATKFAPYPWRVGRGSIVQACRETLERLQRPCLDVAQLHWSPPLGWQEDAYIDGLADCVDRGMARAIGVSNYGPVKLQGVVRQLKARGLTLASNQVQLSLLSRVPLESGLLDTCRENGVVLIGYSPLCLGLLSGKYDADNMPKGARGVLFRQLLPKVGPLIQTLREVANERSKTVGQVALNWCLAKGAVPLVGVKTAKQAEENLGALGWRLSEAEVRALDDVSSAVKAKTLQNIFQTA